jgi:hypothetical protein
MPTAPPHRLFRVDDELGDSGGCAVELGARRVWSSHRRGWSPRRRGAERCRWFRRRAPRASAPRPRAVRRRVDRTPRLLDPVAPVRSGSGTATLHGGEVGGLGSRLLPGVQAAFRLGRRGMGQGRNPAMSASRGASGLARNAAVCCRIQSSVMPVGRTCDRAGWPRCGGWCRGACNAGTRRPVAGT